MDLFIQNSYMFASSSSTSAWHGTPGAQKQARFFLRIGSKKSGSRESLISICSRNRATAFSGVVAPQSPLRPALKGLPQRLERLMQAPGRLFVFHDRV